MFVPTPKPIAGEEPTYSRSVFEAILAGIGGHDDWKSLAVLSAEGVRVKDVAALESLSWHPSCELMAPGSPNPLDEPWLRFPFTARQLAALMTDGWGYFIQDSYGDWQDGPDEDALQNIAQLGGKAKEALTAAYAAYRYAVEMAPRRDHSLERKARGLAEQHGKAREDALAREGVREKDASHEERTARLARVNATVADQKRAVKEARLDADLAHSHWRRAVVQHLLLPIEMVSADCFELMVLRGLPPDRRAEALHQIQAQRAFVDSPEGKAQWDLMCEISDVEQEIRDWQRFNAQSIDDLARRKDELKELTTRLADLNARMNDMDRGSAGNHACINAAGESTEQRQQRRLADLRRFGGNWVKRGADWRAEDRQSGAFGKLVEQEGLNGSRNRSAKSVRRDLCAAAQAEDEKRRAGVMLKGLTPP